MTHDDMHIIHWPDPRLTKASRPVERFDGDLRELAGRMLELMRQARGVGLAAPQVGRNMRLFVMNATGQAEDDRVYVNPLLFDAEGEAEGEEGCLSLPGVTVKVIRAERLRMRAQDLEGRAVEEEASGLTARVWQHETDHLNGVLLLDRMGSVGRLAHRRTLRELEAEYEKRQGSRKRVGIR